MKIPSLTLATTDDARSALVQRLFSDLHKKAPVAPVTASAVQTGSPFIIPLVVPVGLPTGDGRSFEKDSLSSRELPLPLLWQFKTSDGHDHSVIVGRIDSVEIGDAGLTNAHGVFDTNPYAREAERMIRNGFLRGISADLDKFSGTQETEETLSNDDDDNKRKIKNKEIKIDEARLTGVTIVSMPAFEECKIILLDHPEPVLESDIPMSDGEYIEGVEGPFSDPILASAAPTNPPHEWFKQPKTAQPEPLSISEEGRVHGYLALWESSHIGMAGRVRPPKSASNYRFFRTGVVRTDDGTDVTTGSLTLTGGHAPIQASAEEAARHYDDTNSAVIDVVAGEDRFGIWLAGAVRPNVSAEQLRAMRASAVSGDWRPINGRLELVRACFVNTPGFMTTRAMVASGSITALVAAGTSTLEKMREERDFKYNELSDAISNLTNKLNSVGNSEHHEVIEMKNSSTSEFTASPETLAKLDAMKLKSKHHKAVQKFNSNNK